MTPTAPQEAARERSSSRQPRAGSAESALDLGRLRAEFPILSRSVHGKPLVYLDNAATGQKPKAVIEAVDRFYREDYANIHRGVHLLSERATKAFEDARGKLQRFLNAGQSSEIVFTRGATEAINLVAQSWGRRHVGAGDEVLITEMEHHSNIVPWQMLCEEKGAVLKVAPITDSGEIVLEEFERLLGPRTRLAAIVHASNTLGTVNPVAEMVRMAHQRGVPVLLDGAQATPHLRVDVRALDCDFYAFSGHKLFGPTGIGALYGKAALLEAMPPWQGGGDMIRSVSFKKTTYNAVPHRFEAGTPDIAGAIGLGAAIDWLQGQDRDALEAHERRLLERATERVGGIPGVRIVGTAREKVAVLSFVVEGVHPHDIGTIVDREGVAIRTGHHCTEPLMERLGLPATARASFAFYNTEEEVEALARAIEKAKEVFA